VNDVLSGLGESICAAAVINAAGNICVLGCHLWVSSVNKLADSMCMNGPPLCWHKVHKVLDTAVLSQ